MTFHDSPALDPRNRDDDDGGDGSSDGGDGGDGGSDGGDGGTGNIGLGTIELGFLEGSRNVLESFIGNPRRFILGAVLATILDGLFNIVSVAIEGIQIATEALASVPTLIADSLTGAGATIGTDIFQLVVSLNDPLFAAANTTGALAPVLVTLVVVAEVAIVLVVGERIIRVLLDAIPGGGGII